MLAIDPVGQGERDQYFPASDPSGFFKGPTNQHEVGKGTARRRFYGMPPSSTLSALIAATVA